MKTQTIRSRLKSAAASGLGYGLGLAAGSVVMQLIFSSVHLPERGFFDDDTRFMIGLLLVFAIAMLGGGIGGFVGGWTLPTVGRPRGRWGYAWHSAISLGIPYGTVLYLLVFIIFSVAVGDNVGVTPQQGASLFGVLGGLFGAAVGLLLGVVTVGRRFLRVTLAGLVGFAIGGAGLGLAVWAFFSRLPRGAMTSEGPYLFIVLGIFLLGLGGGTGFGYAFDGLAYAASQQERKPQTKRAKIIWGVVAAVCLLLFVSWLWPMLLDLDQVMMPRSANLSKVLDSDAVGTHWSHQTELPTSSRVKHPALAAYGTDLVALAWTEGDGEGASLRWASGTWLEEQGEVRWAAPATVSSQRAGVPAYPQIAFGPDGALHLLWLEQSQTGQSDILYTRCDGGTCSDPTVISDPSGSACGEEAPASDKAPAMAVSGTGTVVAVWGDARGRLEFATWDSDTPSPSPARGCVPSAGEGGRRQPRLAASDEKLILVLNQGSNPSGEIALLEFVQDAWSASEEVIGSGSMPEVWIDSDNGVHAAWCDKR
jgi:hypothetical protein